MDGRLLCGKFVLVLLLTAIKVTFRVLPFNDFQSLSDGMGRVAGPVRLFRPQSFVEGLTSVPIARLSH
jgi:hypothetical protein